MHKYIHVEHAISNLQEFLFLHKRHNAVLGVSGTKIKLLLTKISIASRAIVVSRVHGFASKCHY